MRRVQYLMQLSKITGEDDSSMTLQDYYHLAELAPEQRDDDTDSEGSVEAY